MKFWVKMVHVLKKNITSIHFYEIYIQTSFFDVT